MSLPLPVVSDWMAKPIEISTPAFRLVAHAVTHAPATAPPPHHHKHHHHHTHVKQEHDPHAHAAAALTNGTSSSAAAAAAAPSHGSASLSSPQQAPVVSSRGRIIKLKLHADDAGTSSTWTNVAIAPPPDTAAPSADGAHPPPPSSSSHSGKSREHRKRKAEDPSSSLAASLSSSVVDDPSLEVEDMSDAGMLLRHSRSLHQLKREYVLTCFPDHDHQLLTEEGFVTLKQVQAQLAQHGSMRVACPVDGRLEYHAIGAGDLTVHTGLHRHVRMEGRAKSATHGSEQISLLPTDNHRMFVRLSDSCSAKHAQQQPELPSVPPFSIHTAAAVLKAGQVDATTMVQFTGMCELGVVADGSPLAFAAALGLRTDQQLDDFLQLYGLWLACDGALDDQAVCFTTNGHHATTHLDRLCTRLNVSLVERTTRGMQRQHCITSPQWRQQFESLGSRKRIGAWVWRQLDRRQLRLLIDAMRRAEADNSSTVDGGSLAATCALYRDQLQRLCFHAGFSAWFEQTSDGWRVLYSSADSVALPQLHVASECSLEEREGTVWCVSVPTAEQLIVFRRVLATDASGTVTAASRPLVVGNTLKRHRLKRSVSTPRTPSLTATPKTPRGGNNRPSKLSHSASMSQLSNQTLPPLSPTHTSSSANISPQQSPMSHASGVMSASALDWPGGGGGSAHPSPLPSPPMSRQSSLEPLSLTPSASSQSLPQIDEDVSMQPMDSSASGASLEIKTEGGLVHTHPGSMSGGGGGGGGSMGAKLESSPSSSTNATAGSTLEEKDPCPSPSSSPNDPNGGLDPFASWSDVSSSVLPLPTSWSLQSAGIDPSSMYYLKAWQAQAHLTNAPVAQPKFNYDSTARPWRLPKKYILCLTPPLTNHAQQLAQMHASNANIITLPAAAFLQAASAPAAVKSEAEESAASAPPAPPAKRSHSRKEPLEGGDAKKSKKGHTSSQAAAAGGAKAGTGAGTGAQKPGMSAASSKAHAALDQELQEKQKLLAYLQVRCQLLRVREAKGLPPNPDAPTPAPETKETKKEKKDAAAAAAAVAAAAAAAVAAAAPSSATASTAADSSSSASSAGATVPASATVPTAPIPATGAASAPGAAVGVGVVAAPPAPVRRHHTRDKKKLTEAGAALAADNAVPKPAPTPRAPRPARAPATGARAAAAAEKSAAAAAAAAAVAASAAAGTMGISGSTSTGIGMKPSSRASTPPNPATGSILLPSSSSSLLSGLAPPIGSPSTLLTMPLGGGTTTGAGVSSSGGLSFTPSSLLPLTLPPLPSPITSTSVVPPLSTTSSLLTTSLGVSSSSASGLSSSVGTTSGASSSALSLDTSNPPLFPMGGLGGIPYPQYDAAQLSQLAGIDVNTMVLLAQAQFQLSLTHPGLFGFGGLMPGLMGNFSLNTPNLGAFNTSSSSALTSNTMSANTSAGNAPGLMMFGTGSGFDLKAFTTGSSAAAASSSSASSSVSSAPFSSSFSMSSSSASTSTPAPVSYSSSSSSSSSSGSNGSSTSSGSAASSESSKSGNA